MKLWKDQELMNSQVFEVTCGLGGTFLPPEIHPEKIKRNYLNGWPLCDRATPAKCSNYQPANAEQLQIVELIKKEDQLPGMNSIRVFIKMYLYPSLPFWRIRIC